MHPCSCAFGPVGPRHVVAGYQIEYYPDVHNLTASKDLSALGEQPVLGYSSPWSIVRTLRCCKSSLPIVLFSSPSGEITFVIIKSSKLLAEFVFRDRKMKVHNIEFEIRGSKRRMHFDKTMIRNSKQPENRTTGMGKMGSQPNRKAIPRNLLAERLLVLGVEPNGLR